MLQILCRDGTTNFIAFEKEFPKYMEQCKEIIYNNVLNIVNKTRTNQMEEILFDIVLFLN